jgi:hypothetical protein
MKRLTFSVAVLALAVTACDQGAVTDVDLPQDLTPADALEMMAQGENPPPSFFDRFPVEPIDVTELLAVPENTPFGDAARLLSPATFFATLGEGESAVEHKTVDIAGTPAKGDVVFSLDLTGSMGGELNNAKGNSIDIMNAVSAALGDVAFGVISYMDYPGHFSSCGYSSTYGYAGSGDYPYRLDQSVTTTYPNVTAAINGLSLGNGADGPESYARALYETYADENIAWRPGARRIVVNWGDAMPHDCDVYGPIGYSSYSTGMDPGRDGIVGTADDLPMMDVLDGMKANGITLVNLFSGGTTISSLWDAYAAYLGGGSTNFRINYDGSFPSGLDPATEITALIEAAVGKVSSLTLVPCDGYGAYASWISDLSPSQHTDLTLPASVDFDVTYSVPAGTAAGTYTFDLCAVGDAAEYGRQTVTIEYVLNNPPVADAGADQVGEAAVECSVDDAGGTAVTLDGSASSDPDGDDLTYAWYEGATLLSTDAITTVHAPVGTHTYTLVVSDGEFSDSDEVVVTIEDTTPPDVTLAVANGTLWPPNHKYVEIDVSASATDACDAGLALSGHVVSSEPDNAKGNGDGNTTGDIRVVQGDGTVLLSSNANPSVPFNPTTDRLWVRAERAGGQGGRTYTITFTAEDASGNASTATATVVVPHNQGP